MAAFSCRRAPSSSLRPCRRPDGAVELLVGLSRYDGAVEDFAEGLLVLREDLRDPVLRSQGAAWEATLTTTTTTVGECSASVPDVPA